MKALLSIVLLLAFGACAWGDTPTPEEIAQWKEDAANGYAEAQFELGEAYFYGEEANILAPGSASSWTGLRRAGLQKR